MKEDKYVTISQAKKLRFLGFNEQICSYQISGFKEVLVNCPRDWNNQVVLYSRKRNKKPYLSVPTVDEAIDWLLRKKNVYILHYRFMMNNCNNCVRYACEISINYAFPYISTKLSRKDINNAKRDAINIALNKLLKKELPKK